MLSLVENLRRKQIAWVEFVLAHKRWNKARLAREGGFSHSTLTKFLNDKHNVAKLETAIVEKIERASGIPAYQVTAPLVVKGLAEEEATPYVDVGDEMIRLAVQAIKASRNGVDTWVLQSRALEQAGYMPGDILVIDNNMDPNDGDLVFAEIDNQGRKENVMRFFLKPFLVSATSDNKLRRPLLVDGERVQLRGTVLTSFRPRHAA